MRKPKGLVLWAILLLMIVGAVSLVTSGEITLKTGEAGEAQWWYCGEYGDYMACDSCGPTDCYVADHWGVELATYSKGALAAGNYDGDWAYLAQQVARRFTLAEVVSDGTHDLGFYYNMVDVPNQPAATQTASGPSLAFSLIDPVTEDHWLAISEAADDLQTASCVPFIVDTVDPEWWYAAWDGEDVGTFDQAGVVNPTDFAALQAAIGTYDVVDVLVLMGVAGEIEGGDGTNLIEPGKAVIDDIALMWNDGTDDFGGVYLTEPAWDAVVGFDDWTQTPLPLVSDPPREWDKWCTDDVLCPHCLPLDDQNLWGLVRETDLDGVDIPAVLRNPDGSAKDFPSSEHALYFGTPTTGDYDRGEATVGTVCSPWNELNPGDRYLSLTFQYFREVEQYLSGPYDWTYVQIAFDDWAVATGAYDPWLTANANTGDAAACGTPSLDWKTVWYKDSRDANESDWTEAVITHYLDQYDDPRTDTMYRIAIPPAATRVKIRFGFNSVDGSSNDHFGWIIDDIEKQHAPDPPGCRIITDYLPQAHVGEKYGDCYDEFGVQTTSCTDPTTQTYFKLEPEVLGGSVLGPRSWSILSVTKDGQRVDLPRRMALDPRGRLYGEPDPGTEGTYQITFLLECWNGRPDEVMLVFNITSPVPPTSSLSLIRYEDFDGVSSMTWMANGAPLGPAAVCPSLWHETSHVKYVLDSAALKAEYGDVAYFGQDDNGVDAELYDPNYRCSRAKGCLESNWIPITVPEHAGEELIIGFKSWRNVEYFTGGDYDRTWVEVRFEDGGTWETVWEKSSKDVSLASWTWQEVRTGLLLKEGVKFQIRFCFDSLDAYSNDAPGEAYGWLIDEISLYAGSTNLGITSCPREETSVGDYYREQIRASGGAATALVWEIGAGALPPGLGIVPDPLGNRGVAYIEGVPREPGTFNFTIRVRANDWSESATRDCTIIVGEEVILLLEDFEDDPAWSQGGLWHFTTDAGVPGVVDGLGVTNHAAYYGQDDAFDPNFETGARTSGMLTLVTPAIDLTQIPGGGAAVEAVKVTLDFWREVEGFGNGGYDKTEVQVQLDGGDWKTIWERDSSDPSAKTWITETAGPFLTDGAASMVIRFVFDSVDRWYNDFVGWLVDNLKVESASATGASPLSAMAAASRVEPRDLASELSVMNIPNPIRDVHTTTFMVRSIDVDAMRIEIYDLAGTLVFEEEVAGNELVWHTENDYGEYLANGIYLYRAFVSVHGEWVATKAEKLVILR
jgi:hypothetical protein